LPGRWDTYFANVVQQGSNFDLAHVVFGDIQLSGNSDRPFRQASAMHTRANVPEIEELVKRTDQRVAKCEMLLLQFFNADERVTTLYFSRIVWSR